MFGDQLRGMGMVLEDARKFQLPPAETEIDGGLLRLDDKLGQIIAGAEPRENAVAQPAPGNDFFARQIGGEVPAMFERELFDAAMQAVIVPAECHEHAPLVFWHNCRSSRNALERPFVDKFGKLAIVTERIGPIAEV